MELVSHPGTWEEIFPDMGKACDLFLPIHCLSSVCCFRNKFLPTGLQQLQQHSLNPEPCFLYKLVCLLGGEIQASHVLERAAAIPCRGLLWLAGGGQASASSSCPPILQQVRTTTHAAELSHGLRVESRKQTMVRGSPTDPTAPTTDGCSCFLGLLASCLMAGLASRASAPRAQQKTGWSRALALLQPLPSITVITRSRHWHSSPRPQTQL